MTRDVEILSVAWAKSNYRKVLVELFPADIYPKQEKPFSIFLAGAPGVGKTEFGSALIKSLTAIDGSSPIIHLDVDAFRERFKEYDGKNSSDVQRACTILFEKTFDHIQKNSQNAIIDITFSSPKSVDDVRRSINRGRSVNISYLYQDPLIAWNYTKKRERLEGRLVPKKVFLDAYFNSRDNVQKAKDLFKDKITLDLYIKSDDNSVKKQHLNVQAISGYLKESYTRKELEDTLPDVV